MNCIILGDKHQQGMKSKGCPALISINQKTNLLINQYTILKSLFKNINITYIYGFDNKKFTDFVSQSDLDIQTFYNSHHVTNNQAFSLSLAHNLLSNNENLLIVDGYQKLNKNIFKKFKENNGSKIFLNKKEDYNRENSVGCIIHEGSVTNFSFDLVNSIYNIYYIDKQHIKELKKMLKEKKYFNNFIFELINKLIDQGLKITPV